MDASSSHQGEEVPPELGEGSFDDHWEAMRRSRVDV
jgi:hypothetical protein